MSKLFFRLVRVERFFTFLFVSVCLEEILEMFVCKQNDPGLQRLVFFNVFFLLFITCLLYYSGILGYYLFMVGPDYSRANI